MGRIISRGTGGMTALAGPATQMDAVSPVVERFSREIYAATDPQAGIELLSAAAVQLGLAGACCCLWPRASVAADSPPPPCVLLYAPQHDAKFRSWFAEYIRSDMQRSDPCLEVCRASTAPFVWSLANSPQIVRGRAATATQVDAVDALYRNTGVGSGIAVPLQGPGSWFGYCSFASRSHAGWVLEQREALEDPLLAMSYRFYDAMADRLSALIARASGLSEQELECLGLLAVGKTVAEVAQICGLPYSTVRSRLRGAERKLAARNRSHAIATAAALGLLDRIN